MLKNCDKYIYSLFIIKSKDYILMCCCSFFIFFYSAAIVGWSKSSWKKICGRGFFSFPAMAYDEIVNVRIYRGTRRQVVMIWKSGWETTPLGFFFGEFCI